MLAVMLLMTGPLVAAAFPTVQVNGFDLTNFGDFCTAIRKYVMHMHMSTINHEVLTEVAELELEADHQVLNSP